MKKIELHPTAVLRLPAFSYAENLKTNWDAFKDAIEHSSPGFFQLIKDLTFDQLQATDKKIQLTIQKYFNRASFRSTPYGKFADLTVVPLSINPDLPIIVEEQPIHHTFPDWVTRPKEKITLEDAVRAESLIFSNTSFYRLQNEIRYIQNSEDKFVLAAVDFNEIVFDILETCSLPRSYDQLKIILTKYDSELLDAYLSDMLGTDLLFTSKDANIIGEDFFSRIGDTQIGPTRQYIISEKKVITGSLDKRLFRHIPDLVQKLQGILPDNKVTNLEEFKTKFVQKFEQAEVPFLIALDPDAGIDYGNLSMAVEQPKFEKLILQFASEVEETGISKFRQFLYREILQNIKTGKEIRLENFSNESKQFQPLPNTFSAIINLADDTIFLQSMGGASATALLGRFALALPEVFKHCQELVSIEQEANPSVLFFDIGYTKEDNIDNINRRPSIYDQQLNILNFNTSACPLSMHDILISVRSGEVILQSKRYGKRLIPRVASAYNHRRSDLPVYRLLIDIQNQGVKTNLLFNPSQLIPGLPFYPRVKFRNIVVCPASWSLSIDIIKGIVDLDGKILAIKNHLKSFLSGQYFKIGRFDQTLFLNIKDLADIEILLSILEKDRKIFLEEAYLPGSPSVQNCKGQPFLTQIILSLSHNEEIYLPLTTRQVSFAAIEEKSWIAPGKDWLYFEIYCNPFRADFLLRTKIKSFLASNKPQIRNWFFIRYDENGSHIRLRLQLRNRSCGYQLMEMLTDILEPEIRAGVVADVKIKTYKREVHRYSTRLMSRVEKHFCCDSRFVINSNGAALTDMKKYRLCIEILESIRSKEVLTAEVFYNVITKITNALNQEHEISGSAFKELNQKYNVFLTEPFPRLNYKLLQKYHSLIKSFITLLADCDDFNRVILMADLIHMHVNRMFTSDQRKHEMVIYNLYQTMLKAKAARESNFLRA
ncbi:lantibiotic dehydratase [Pedobacter steynii]|uniref:Thiopeptide-type bacteriocin biosynthesis domain-containing protein n=1 Tax=Pedobacter steynii TaxID=430522 RepID=A0A1D7QN10_9SPHI|nr:lantibiotic dehydratase [Pedobacter steynii]AOM80048.1 hypothetical protein BFS30_24520 [Pedobacter steynii]